MIILLEVLVMALIVAADQIVKAWVSVNVSGQGDIILIENVLRITYIENRGAALGILQDQRIFFIIITILTLSVILFLRYSGRVRSLPGVWATLFIIGGAIGNLIDRIRSGFVVDMFEFIFVRFAVFNVADIFVSVGAVLMCIYILRYYEKDSEAYLADRRAVSPEVENGGEDTD